MQRTRSTQAYGLKTKCTIQFHEYMRFYIYAFISLFLYCLLTDFLSEHTIILAFSASLLIISAGYGKLRYID